MISIKIFTFNAFQENTYLLYDETGEAIIVDPGCYGPEDQKVFSGFISDNGLQVKLLVNTHCHIDHVFGNYYVIDKYKVDLVCHEKEEVNLRSVKIFGQPFGFSDVDETAADQYVDEGDEIRFGNSSLKTLFVPGHSPGHIALLHDEQKICFSGDVLFRNSIGRTDLPGGDYQELLKSIRNKLFVLDDDIVIYPGHGPSTTIGYEKKKNPFLQTL